MVNDPIGKNTTHPDVLDLLLATLNEGTLSPTFRGLRREEIRLLQQRTFYDQADVVALAGDAPHTISLSNCLAIVTLSDAQVLLLSEFSKRSDAGEWRWEGSKPSLIGSPPVVPYKGASLLDKRGYSIDLFVTHPDIAMLRMTLADGRTLEDTATNDCLLLYVPFPSPASWSGPALQQLFGWDGREIAREPVSLIPYPRSGATGTSRGVPS